MIVAPPRIPDVALAILRCPFCGGGFRFVPERSNQPVTEATTNGILNCACNAFPVVADIPYVRNDEAAAAAMNLVSQGLGDDALVALARLPLEPAAAFLALAAEPATSFRALLPLLVPGPEGAYLLFRFSDPTFLAGDAVVRSIATDPALDPRPVIDLCGGTGHLTRSLAQAAKRTTFLADADFGKLWLAHRFVVPEAVVVCCDADEPLPFGRNDFSLAVCSDAFHYIWRRRRLADELLRLVGARGAVLLPHLHNALVWNDSQGMPLTPTAYRELFRPVPVVLLREADVLNARLSGRQQIDCSGAHHNRPLGDQHAVILVATERRELFRLYPPLAPPAVMPGLRINPLFEPAGEDEGGLLLVRRFPSEHYEAEYAASKHYLPEQIQLTGADLEALAEGVATPTLLHLRSRHALLDLPPRYI